MSLATTARDAINRARQRVAKRLSGGISEQRSNEPRSRRELHDYWASPTDRGNHPEEYAAARDRSEFLVALLERYVDHDAHVLEVGTNVGRNLEHLRRAGFRSLTGIELSRQAVQLMQLEYPNVAREARILNLPVEDAIVELADDGYDVVFTMAVLEHIHPDSEWVFREMTRVMRRLLITIEDEQGVSERHFPRNYERIFEPLGLTQVESTTQVDGLPGFTARVLEATRR